MKKVEGKYRGSTRQVQGKNRGGIYVQRKYRGSTYVQGKCRGGTYVQGKYVHMYSGSTRSAREDRVHGGRCEDPRTLGNIYGGRREEPRKSANTYVCSRFEDSRKQTNIYGGRGKYPRISTKLYEYVSMEVGVRTHETQRTSAEIGARI